MLERGVYRQEKGEGTELRHRPLLKPDKEYKGQRKAGARANIIHKNGFVVERLTCIMVSDDALLGLFANSGKAPDRHKTDGGATSRNHDFYLEFAKR